MSQINVNNLTFAYEGSFDNVFENASFSIDTNWKMGFIGRNGKGKTTFLNLLLGKYEYTGSISTGTVFDYFPYVVNIDEMQKSADELMSIWKPGVESWRVMCELPELSIDAELLYKPLGMLSFGERTKIMLAVLFSGENDFLLISELIVKIGKIGFRRQMEQDAVVVVAIPVNDPITSFLKSRKNDRNDPFAILLVNGIVRSSGKTHDL